MTTIEDSKESYTVVVRFFGLFKLITEKREIKFTLNKDAVILDLLDEIITLFPSIKDELFDENNRLRKWVMILRNGRNIKIFNGIETKITKDDVIAIFPPTAGG